MSSSKDSKQHFLYELWVEGESNPFYVGRTSDPSNRYAKHICDSTGRESHLRKARKIVKALREGKTIHLKCVQSFFCFDEIKEAEKALVAQYGRLDLGNGVLCNHTDGGDGHENYVWSDDARLRASKRMMGSRMNQGRDRPDMRERMSNEVYAYTRDGAFHSKYSSQKEAAIALGCLAQTIGKCCLGKARCCRGKSGEVFSFSRKLVSDAPVFPMGTVHGDAPKAVKMYVRSESHRAAISESLKLAYAEGRKKPHRKSD